MNDPMTKVLCIDDTQGEGDSTAAMLRLAGFDAMGCRGAEQALRDVASFAPDVCVIDLPERDDALPGRLRDAAGRPLRCIALTRSWDVASRSRADNDAPETRLAESVEPERLLAALRGE
jgi:DNA-binding NtrC family response regulator